ncbi:universal stress protein [Deinococcus sp. KNUC1210]|uniref:universal stress protein n=1 Tax=Deinococcus sp. KNUC1210 TaxID=2917691 RepID=UPI001EF13B96|nr:universal stress protein [Deinococcus sp. KNUC1210]ULH14687.1 universal stress protein [Deinococcus sp. KNUC1210]
MNTALVGYTQDASGQDALALGRLIARHAAARLLVCTVVPEAWAHPSLGAVDQEYAAYLEEHAQETLESARAALEDVPDVQYLRQAANSATTGLSEAAAQHGADLIVLGSSHSGSSGRLSLGSMSSELLHLSSLPVALAPRDYAAQAPANGHITRLSCAYAGTEVSNTTVLEALRLATLLGVPLRLVAFAVRDRQMYPSLAGFKAENMIVDAWRERTGAALERLKEQLAGVTPPIESVMADGEGWDAALSNVEWQPGELLALGSSRMGVLKRVFLGSNASKIMRAAPVPVLVLPKVG